MSASAAPLLKALRARRSVILCYHGIGPPGSADDPHYLRVSPAMFRSHLDALGGAGFEFVTVEALAERANGGTPPPGLAALSFDDGMEDNHSELLPILREYGIPATVYVTTGLIGKQNPWIESGNVRMMTEAELRYLAGAGVELGAHTVTHPDMSALDRATCLREMQESRSELERITGAPVRTFAYPFCKYGPDALAAAEEAGFLAAVTCHGRGGWSRYEMKRAMITGKDGWPSFVLKLAEAYQPLFDSPPGRAARVSTRGLRRQFQQRRRTGPTQHYVHVAYPWSAVIDTRSPYPARFYTALVGQALRYRLPARRRYGSAWALAARSGLPEGPASLAVRAWPREPRPELDHLREQLTDAWPALAAGCQKLPASAPELTLLALDKRAALTVFAFADDPQPLVVAKLPSEADGRVDHEVRMLEEAAPAGISPAALGTTGRARVQEALPGAPLGLVPIRAESAGSLAWSPRLASLADGLARLGEHTVKKAPAEDLREPVQASLDWPVLSAGTRSVVAAALSDLERLDVAVLEHRDGSSQNCLFVGDRLSGLVDWEMARSNGVPGFDVLNSSLAYMEYGLGLVRWTEPLVVGAFEAAWRSSPFWAGARAAAARAAAAAGVPETLHEPLQIAFFARRLGHRMEGFGEYPTGAATAAAMLEVVCGR